MAGEIFYQPPQPTQATPHVPISTPGSQPPRRTIVTMMACVLASWPTGLEYQAPQRAPTVPIPKQGQQPPRRNDALGMATVLQSWPTGFEYQPYQLPRRPPIPNQGQQPPPYSLAEFYLNLEPHRPPDPWPVQRPLTEVPLTLTYGDQSPRIRRSLEDLSVILRAWEPPPPLPQQTDITVPIPRQGDAPPKQKSQQPAWEWYLSSVQLPSTEQTAAVIPALVVATQPPFVRQLDSIRAAWEPDAPARQRSTVVPIPAQGGQPPRYSTTSLLNVVSTWTPPDPQPRQLPLTVAPLTLTYGDTPPKYSPAALYSLIAAWTPPDPQPQQRPTTLRITPQGDAPPKPRGFVPGSIYHEQPAPQQAVSQVAAFAVPPAVVRVPFVRQPDHVRASWETSPSPPPTLTLVAPLTLTYGQQPPRKTSASLAALIESWREPPPAPRQRAVTAPIPIQGDVPPPLKVLSYWTEEPYQPRQQLAQVAAFTVTVRVPPVSFPWAVLSWFADAYPTQRRNQPAAIVNAGQFPPPTSAVTLNVILTHWAPPDPLPKNLPLTAPLTLAYGDQPPGRKPNFAQPRDEVPPPEPWQYRGWVAGIVSPPFVFDPAVVTDSVEFAYLQTDGSDFGYSQTDLVEFQHEQTDKPNFQG